MTMPRFLLSTVLGLLLLGTAGYTFVQHKAALELQARVAQTEKERNALQLRVTELEKLNRDLAARGDRGRRGPEEVDSDAPVARAAGPGTPDAATMVSRARAEENRFANLLARPEIRELMATQAKAGLDGRYAALFRKLGLSGPELERFKELIVQKQSTMTEVMMEARAQGLTGRENRDELRKLGEQLQTEVDANIRATLGEAGYAQYKNYEATLPQRGLANQLDQRLSYTSAPLTPNQVEQLVQILHDTRPTSADRPGGPGLIQAIALGGTSGGMFNAQTRITDATIAQARGILSAPQIAALESLQQEQRAAAQLSEQMRASRREAPPRPTGP